MKNEIYPNAPLVEAIFEIRFPANLAVECHRDKIYDVFKGDLPQVFVPNIPPNTAPALGLYNFQSDDQAKTVLFSINTCSFSSKKYPGFKAFSLEALRYLNLFGKKFKLSGLKRIGLRYVNIIPYTRENGFVPVKRFFNFGFNLPEVVPQELKGFEAAFTTNVKNDGLIATKLMCLQRGGQEVFLLDFDYSKGKKLLFTDLRQYLEESHEETKKFFEAFITEEYRKLMRGEIIK